MSLLENLTLSGLKQWVDAKTFARGLDYYHTEAVGMLEGDADFVSAVVQGTRPYRVSLRVSAGKLGCRCNCPVGGDGAVCKHAVALALAWLEREGEEVFPPPEAKATRKPRKTQKVVLADYLATLDGETLQRLLLDAAASYPALKDRLLFAAKASASGDLAGLRAAVQQATRMGRFLDWQEVSSYAERLYDLADLLHGRLADGDQRLIGLVEEAVAKVASTLENVDDSNGEVSDAVQALQDVHVDACIRLRPEPVALAERLFQLQAGDEWGFWSEIHTIYAQPLGAAGLQRYRELVTAAWVKQPPMRAGERRPGLDGGLSRYLLESILLAFALQDGDVEQAIAIRAKDLSGPHRFLALAQLCQEHGRADMALSWAEQGLAAFPKDLNLDLLTFCIDAQVRNGNADKTDQLAWRRFAHMPHIDAYAQLLAVAKAIGRHAELRQRALAHLWAKVAEEEAQPARKRPYGGAVWHAHTRSLLLEIYLQEQEGEEAWRTLQGGPTSTALWFQAAAMRSTGHPDEALALYFKLLPIKVNEGAIHARYEEAAEVVRAIGKLRAQQGEPAKFAEDLASIRASYKAKRNFIKALAGLGG